MATMDHAEWECGTCESAAVAVATAMAKLNLDYGNPEHLGELRECGRDLRRARRALICAVADEMERGGRAAVDAYLADRDKEEAARPENQNRPKGDGSGS